jgi:hypothetical protein
MDRAIYPSESHDHRCAKSIDEGGPLRRDRMVFEFTTTCAIVAYHHY